MKFPTILRLMFILMLMPVMAKAQDSADANAARIKEVGDSACECTGKISTAQIKDSIVSQINSCISGQIMTNQIKNLLGGLSDATNESSEAKADTLSNKKTITIYADQDFDAIQAYMLKNCKYVKTLMSVHDLAGKNSMSTNKKALEYYDEGLNYSANQQYDLAIVSYSKAVKKDPKFAFAWDNLGMSYRRRGNFKEAIKCYEKSLEIDPDGTMPLQNMAVAYGLLEDWKKAAEVYEEFIKLHPDDPEGYFGAGRSHYVAGNFEKGVDNMFKAYRLYKEKDSPYVNDAHQLLGSFYQDLKEKNKLEIFTEAAKNNGVNIN